VTKYEGNQPQVTGNRKLTGRKEVKKKRKNSRGMSNRSERGTDGKKGYVIEVPNCLAII
jgi:hypothetical protein